MCGILGIIPSEKSYLKDNQNKVSSMLETLYKVSQSRGKDASGIATIKPNEIKVFKRPFSAGEMIGLDKYKALIEKSDDMECIIGHARMETNGSFAISNNNQPVVKDDVVSIHNGIVVNVDTLWSKFKKLKRKYTVDTEVINSLIRYSIKKKKDIVPAVKDALSNLKGSFSLCIVFSDVNSLLLTTNTGSLFLIEPKDKSFVSFVSEKVFAEKFINKEFSSKRDKFTITKIDPGTGVLIDFGTLKKTPFVLNKTSQAPKITTSKKRKILVLDEPGANDVHLEPVLKSNIKNEKDVYSLVRDGYEEAKEKISNLQRCTRCILPETMPFIKFDSKGVCNYCHNYIPREIFGRDSLEKRIRSLKLSKDRPNCIVSFSGGRDSSYALHFAKKELGLNPLAFSYDWGMLTDLGRRNQTRMTGKLGVEHILVAADIKSKREYIRKNVEAWLEKPEIGMIPLFMAGDKQYFYYLNKVMKETKIDLAIYSDNSLEKTDFKYGFAGVNTLPIAGKPYDIGTTNTFKLLWYYFRKYSANLKYINSSLVDTFTAYFSSYFTPKNYISLYRYIKWDEKTVEKKLLGEYEWETAGDTKNTWRIGDGTASFYNYIYYLICGFTENDTFRSNQIREGLISRSSALKRAEIDNNARADSILWYSNTIKIDAKKAVRAINKAKKLY